MKLLYQRLTEHLIQYLPPTYQPNFYSWLVNGKIINQGGDIVHTASDNTHHYQAIEICQMEYEAILWFEALPFKEIEPLKLLTLINVWTAHNDEKFLELNHEIDFEITPIDDTVVDLNLTVRFRESIYGVEDAKKGDIHTHNSQYRLSDVCIWDWENAPPENVRVKYLNRKQSANV